MFLDYPRGLAEFFQSGDGVVIDHAPDGRQAVITQQQALDRRNHPQGGQSGVDAGQEFADGEGRGVVQKLVVFVRLHIFPFHELEGVVDRNAFLAGQQDLLAFHHVRSRARRVQRMAGIEEEIGFEIDEGFFVRRETFVAVVHGVLEGDTGVVGRKKAGVLKPDRHPVGGLEGDGVLNALLPFFVQFLSGFTHDHDLLFSPKRTSERPAQSP